MNFLGQNILQNSFRRFALATCFAGSLLIIITAPVFAQQTSKIDHLTIGEDDLIHDTQELDKRIEVFIKAIDRRLIVLNPTSETIFAAPDSKKSKKKDFDKLGELPTGTRTELLVDVKSILVEAISNIDNAAERDAKNALLPKALKTLADGCTRLTLRLKSFYDSAQNETERAAVYDATENCREIIEAHAKHSINTVK